MIKLSSVLFVKYIFKNPKLFYRTIRSFQYKNVLLNVYCIYTPKEKGQ